MSYINIEETAIFSPDLKSEAEAYAEKKYREDYKVEVHYSPSDITVTSTYARRFVQEVW